jgi:N-methylhydantoinase A
VSLRVATDVGGTFTDMVCFDEESNSVRAAKSSTVPESLSRGVLAAIDAGNIELDEVRGFVHGATVVINAITERKGVRTALVTTRGFRDVLEIGRGNRPDMYNLLYRKPEPFVPRRLRFEVTERVDHTGRLLDAVVTGELEEIAERCRANAVEAIAVCFLHSYVNPANEREARERLAELLPGVSVAISSDITQQWREYERTNTTVLNSYVQPVVGQYLKALGESLAQRRLRATPTVMQSNGGTASFERARDLPINLVESGPAGGIMGAVEIGRHIGEPNVIYFDVGGTTAKCTLIEAGKPKTTTDYKLEWSDRSAGYPVAVPVLDIVEIGAGGGSIASLDPAGGLGVGPESAGAVPGPACYGNGGTRPTVTDAKLLAGVLNADYFLGGRLAVHPELARQALGELGESIGRSPEDTANGVIRLANANMINALKLVSVRRGYDPRDFVLVACGGGGAMHAAALAADLHVKKVVIPPFPGYFSAWGMLVTEPRIDLVRTHILRTREIASKDVGDVFEELIERAHEQLGADQGDREAIMRFDRSVEMRYAGQEHTVSVELVGAAQSVEDIEEAFHTAHLRQYTFSLPETPSEIVNFHLTAYRSAAKPELRRIEADGRSEAAARKGRRAVDFDHDGVHDTPVFERELLPPGFATEGPLLIEEASSTTLVHPGQLLEVDSVGNLLIDPRPS